MKKSGRPQSSPLGTKGVCRCPITLSNEPLTHACEGVEFDEAIHPSGRPETVNIPVFSPHSRHCHRLRPLLEKDKNSEQDKRTSSTFKESNNTPQRTRITGTETPTAIRPSALA